MEVAPEWAETVSTLPRPFSPVSNDQQHVTIEVLFHPLFLILIVVIPPGQVTIVKDIMDAKRLIISLKKN